MKISSIAGLMLMALPATALSSTLYSVSGGSPQLQCLGASCFSQILLTGFNVSTSFNNVSVSVEVGSDNPLDTITAFLTDQIGSTATVASQIATMTFAPQSSDSLVTLFSGLSLAPGQYYIVLAANSTDPSMPYWYSYDPATLVQDSHVVSVVSGSANVLEGTPNTAWAPASTFNTSNSPGLAVQVNSAPSAPEPNTGIFMLFAAAAAYGFRSQSRRAKGQA